MQGLYRSWKAVEYTISISRLGKSWNYSEGLLLENKKAKR